MTLKEILSEIETTDKPVVKELPNAKDHQVLAIGLQKWAILKEHKTDIPAKLYVLKGEVVYRTDGNDMIVKQYEEQVINVGDLHSVKAHENSLFLVIKG